MAVNRRVWKGSIAAVLMGVLGSSACATWRGVKQDTETLVEKAAAGAETVDVKSALIADSRVDSGNINVDTIGDTKTVVLKGSVPTAAQKDIAEAIAREQAKGYRIDNQLVVGPRS